MKTDFRCHYLEEYLQLPRSKRLKFGFWYNRYPFSSLGSGDWRKYENYLKENFVFQFWFRDKFCWWFRMREKDIRDFWYYLKCKFYHRYNYLKLRDECHYSDPTSELPQAIEAVFERFLAEEPFELICWDSDDGHKKAAEVIKRAKYWFRVESFDRQKEMDDILKECFKGSFDDFLDNINKERSAEEKLLLEKHMELEKEFERLETEILCDLVKCRNCLWT